jgi:hypothetical protein
VLDDGTAFLTGRSLARLCGVAYSTIIERKQEWDGGDRGGKFARFLSARGVSDVKLTQTVKLTGGGVGAEADAYPEQVVMAALEYYAFEVQRPEALANFRSVARAGFRLFVYGALGYDPNKLVPGPWREFHDRLSIHAVPAGYFSVFREMSDFIMVGIQNGLTVDHKNVPDISVGKAWGAYWIENDLGEAHGARQKHDHNYPDYFPQAASNPQDMWVYPIGALGEYRLWLQREYIPNKFPAYVASKVKGGALPASMAELLLAAVEPMQLTEVEEN